MLKASPRPLCKEEGFSLLEVIITMAILAVGLLGLAGLQARALNAEAESFARAQAVMLATEMVDRMNSNVTGVRASTGANTGYNQQDAGGVLVEFGTGYTNDCITSNPASNAAQATCCAAKATTAERDLCEWDLALKGVGETTGGAVKLGSMNGARACVFNTGTAGTFQIDVVWQGRDVGVVPAGNTCGSTAITRRSGVSRTLSLAVLNGT